MTASVISQVMLAYARAFEVTYYAQNYASIIRQPLHLLLITGPGVILTGPITNQSLGSQALSQFDPLTQLVQHTVQTLVVFHGGRSL